jgi:Fe-S cluster assembly protein SufD
MRLSESLFQRNGVARMSSVVRVRAPMGASSEWVPAALAQAEIVQRGMNSQLSSVIAEARAVWQKLLFPTPKLEEWKYTNPEAIAQGAFILTSSLQATGADARELLQCARIEGLSPVSELVFVDGVYSASLSSMGSCEGLVVSRLADGSATQQCARIGALGLHREESFAALATSLISDCVCISVARGATVKAPIHIIHLATDSSEGGVVTPRVLVEAAENSEVTIVESHLGVSGVRYLSLPVVEIHAASGATVDYHRIQNESDAAYHVAGMTVHQHQHSTVRTHIFSFGGSLVRNNSNVLLAGAGAQSVLNGLSLLSKSQHVDNATVIHHQQPSAESREHFKGIYAGESKGVFSGTIIVDKVAQKTNAFQSNQALLLSSDASIESRPQLKIWADDVKCTHGATVGQLDSDAMFYLQSRGVGREDARAFLVHAFASEVLTSVKLPEVKGYVEGVLSAKLEAISGKQGS